MNIFLYNILEEDYKVPKEIDGALKDEGYTHLKKNLYKHPIRGSVYVRPKEGRIERWFKKQLKRIIPLWISSRFKRKT